MVPQKRNYAAETLMLAECGRGAAFIERGYTTPHSNFWSAGLRSRFGGESALSLTLANQLGNDFRHSLIACRVRVDIVAFEGR